MDINRLKNIYPDGINFLLTGVGGQGTILASNVLADLGMALGFDVKKAEIHGMSQRGGNVISYIRWGEHVYSPIITKGEADIILAFEKLEALRSIEQIRPDGMILINNYAIVPVTVSSGSSEYPDDENIQESMQKYTSNTYWVKGQDIAEEIGYPKASNVVLLGALTALLAIDPKVVLRVIAARIPQKYYTFNEKAFEAGYKSIQKQSD
ncbi:MAG: indolepyruvate oxidoreductase subunit beta [Anaerolineaceae bacterium]|nr:indolepyruvate oxidoreductase subunit beta [Anaerolineaceae bacterium]